MYTLRWGFQNYMMMGLTYKNIGLVVWLLGRSFHIKDILINESYSKAYRARDGGDCQYFMHYITLMDSES